MRGPHSLGERLRARQIGEAEERAPERQPEPKPEQQAPRTAVVPASSLPYAAHVIGPMVEARRVIADPLESQVSSATLAEAMDSEPAWYQTKLASRIASDLQQCAALNVIFQAVELADPHRDDKNREWERNVSEVLNQGKSLVNRLERYEADFWNPDLRDIAGRVLRVIHPDSRDNRLLTRFSTNQLREMYHRALAARSGQRGPSMGLFVRDAERVLLWQVRTLLSERLSFAEIAKREPMIGADLELIRWARFVKARQIEIAEQLIQGRQRREDHSQATVESFSVIVGAIDALATYAQMEEYPCRNQLVDLQHHLQDVEKLVAGMPDIDRYPMARFKAEQLEGAIKDLVGPVVHIATLLQQAGLGSGITGSSVMASSITTLGSYLEYADSAARSYLDWLRERESSKKPITRLIRPAAY